MKLFTGILIRAGLDSRGQYWSEEALRSMVEDAQPQVRAGQLSAYEDFKLGPKFMQGTVQELTVVEGAPMSVVCSVKVIDTQAGKRIQKLIDADVAVEPAFMGTAAPWPKAGEFGVREYRNVRMTGVAVVPANQKLTYSVGEAGMKRTSGAPELPATEPTHQHKALGPRTGS